MKTFYTAILVVVSLAAQAQILNNGVFEPDTSVSFSIADSKLNVGSPGLNRSWDYSKVIFKDTAFSRMFIPTSATPGFSYFPTANIASTAIRLLPNGVLEADSTTGFLYQNSTRADFLGYYYMGKDGSALGQYSPPMKISVTPFAYNAELPYSVNFKVTSTIAQADAPYHVQKGSGIWKKDAMGKAIFPNKKIASNASRFKNIEELFDTIIPTTSEIDYYKLYVHTTNVSYFISNDQSDESVSVTYSKYVNTTWVKTGGSSPVIETQTEYDTSVVYQRSTTLKEIKTIATGIDEQQEVLNALIAYPVPSNGMISLNSNQIKSVEIIDAKGVLVERQNYEGSITLPANSGLYFIKTILPDGRYKSLKVIRE